MWTPFAWRIEALESDINTIADTVSALGSVDARMCGLDGHLSNLGAHISSGFLVSCSAHGMTWSAKDSLTTSRSTLSRVRGEMEEELDALQRQERSWVAEVERMRREAERRLAEQRRYEASEGGL